MFLLPLFAACDRTSKGIEVVLANKTGANITNVRVHFTGGVINAGTLTNEETYRTYLQPKGESHLELHFRDGAGKEHSHNIGVYFEHGYLGQILIDVLPDGKVVWKDNTHV
jgi:hypothetical protein